MEAIDGILSEELKSDEYILGCFRAEFISEVTKLPREMIEACQKADAYEAIGKGIIAMNCTLQIAKAYVEADSYGHHFNPVDGETLEITDYYVFRIN